MVKRELIRHCQINIGTDDSGFQIYNVVSMSYRLPTFRKTVVPSSSRTKDLLPLKMKASESCETLF